MTKRNTAIISACLTVLMIGFTGSAFAGNGNGNGNGNDGGVPVANGASAASADGAPGKSASAPGQLKNEAPADAGASGNAASSHGGDASAPPAGPTTTGLAGATATASSSTDHSPSHTSQTNPSQNTAGTPGMKPANNTAKSTTCAVSGASGGVSCKPTSANEAATSLSKSDVSKKYGNGTTAAEIVHARGGNGVSLYGPGNSQPHKVSACGGGKHQVDVHAVKRYDAKGCTHVMAPPPSGNPGTVLTGGTRASGGTASTDGTPLTRGTLGSKPAHDPSGRALSSGNGAQGRRHTTTSAKPSTSFGSVLGDVKAAPTLAGATLPFTGFPAWIAALAGLALIAAGVALRRRSFAR
jgi:hypothetical protein